MTNKNKKAEIIKNEQQIQGVIPALLAVDLALSADALKANEQLKLKTKAAKKEASEENEQVLAADLDVAQDIIVADLVDFVVGDDISLTQNKNDCKINSKGQEECDEGGAWWKALLGVGLLGAAAGGGGGGGGSAPVIVPAQATYRHVDFTQNEIEDDTLRINTTTLNQVNVVLDGSEHDEEGTDPLTSADNCDRQLAVDFEGSRGIEIFTTTITDGDRVGLTIDYSSLDLGYIDAPLSQVAMTVNQGSYLELEGGHDLEESNLTVDLTVSQDSDLFNHGGFDPGSSVDVGDYTSTFGAPYAVLDFSSDHAIIGEDLDLSLTSFYASGDVIYDSTDLLQANAVGYIGDNGEIVIDGDCVGEIVGNEIVLNRIGNYLPSDLVHVNGDNADVSISASDSSDIDNFGGNLVDITGINGSVDIEVLTASSIEATADLVTIVGDNADVSIDISNSSYVKSRNDDIVDIRGNNATVSIDLASGSTIDTDEQLVLIVGNSADVHFGISGNSYIDNDYGDLFEITGTNASVDIVVSSSDIYADQSLISVDGDNADISLNVSGSGAQVVSENDDLISIDSDNAKIDIDVTSGAFVEAEDWIVDIVGNSADISVLVTGNNSEISSETNGLLSIDGDNASVDVRVLASGDVSLDDELVQIFGDNADVYVQVSGSSEISVDYGSAISIDGDNATVDLVVTANSDVSVDEDVITILGNSADVSVLVSDDSYISSDEEGLVSIDGDNASVDVRVLDSSAVSLDDELVDISGNNADVYVKVSGQSYVSIDSEAGIWIAGDNATVDLEVTADGNISVEDGVIEIYGNSADVSVLVTDTGSFVSSDEDGLVSIDGDNASVDIDVLAGGQVDLNDELVEIDGDKANVSVVVSGTDSTVSNYFTDVININGDDASVDLDVTANGKIYGEDSIVDIDGINAVVSVLVTGAESYVETDLDTTYTNGDQKLVDIYGDNASVDVQVTAGGEIHVQDELIEIVYNSTDDDQANSSVVSVLASGDGSFIMNNYDDFIQVEGDQADVSVTVKSSADIDAADSLISIDANHKDQATDFANLSVLVTGAGSTLNNVDADEYGEDSQLDYAMVRANSINTTVNFDVLSGATVNADGDLIQISSDDDGIRQVVDNASVDIVVSGDSTLTADGSLVEIDRGSSAEVSLLVDDSSLDAAFISNGSDDLISIDGHDASVDVDVINNSQLRAGDDVVDIHGLNAQVTVTVDESSLDTNEGGLVYINGNSADVYVDINNSSDVDLGGGIVSINDGHDAVISLTMSEDSELWYENAGITVETGNRADIDVDVRDSNIYGEDTLIYVDGTSADITLEMTDGSGISLDEYSNGSYNDNNLIEVDGDDATVNLSMINDDRSYQEGGDSLNITLYGDEADVVNIEGHRAIVNIDLISDQDSSQGNNNVEISIDGDLVDIYGDNASVDISMVNADEISIDGDMVNIDGDNAYIQITSRNPINEPDEDTGLSIDGDLVNVNGHNSTIILDFENLNDSLVRGDFVQVDGNSADLDVTINANSPFHNDLSIDGDLIRLNGSNSRLNLVMDYQVDENLSSDIEGVDSIVDSSGRNANLNVEISDLDISVDGDFIRATNADNLVLSVEIDRTDIEMDDGYSDVFLINGNNASVDIDIQSTNISVDSLNGNGGSDGKLVNATGDDLNLTFTAEDLVVESDNFFNFSAEYIGGIYVSGNSAEIDIDLQDSNFELGYQNDFIRVVDGDNLILNVLADELDVQSARTGIYVDADNASLDIDINGSGFDLNNQLVRVLGKDLTLNLDLTDSFVSADAGIVVSGQAGLLGHTINVELDDVFVSLDLDNSGNGDFLSVTNGQNLDLDLTANDLSIDADSLVSVQNAASADIDVNLVGVSAVNAFTDNMVTVTGADSNTTVSVNITNFGDGALQNVFQNFISGDNLSNINPLIVDGDILNISGQSSDFNLSVTGLTAAPVLGPIPLLLGGVSGHGDVVDLSGNDHSGLIQVADSVMTVDDWSSVFESLGSNNFSADILGFGLTSTTGILELTGNSNDINIEIDNSSFMALSSDYTNNSLIYSDGDNNDIRVDMNSSFMGTFIGEVIDEFYDYSSDTGIPSFFHGEDRVNLAYLEGDSTDFTFDSVNSEFNTRVEIQGSDSTYTHNDDGKESEFNSVHLYVNGDRNTLNVDVNGSFNHLETFHDNIYIDFSSNDDIYGFNGETDTLDIGANNNYTAFQWNSSTNYGFGSDLTTFNSPINSSDSLLDAFGTNTALQGEDNNWQVDNVSNDDLVIFANNSGDFDSVRTALTDAGIDTWFDDIYLVIAEGNVGSDVAVYTWNGSSFTENVFLDGAYSEFFNNSGDVYDSNLVTGGSDDYIDYEVGHEGIAYGGVIVGNNSTIDFNIDSQHLTLSTFSPDSDIDIYSTGLLISSDFGSTTSVDFNLVGGSHLDGSLDLTGLSADSITITSGIVSYDINIKVDASSTVSLDINVFGESVDVDLELDNLNGGFNFNFGNLYSVDLIQNLINLDTSDGATTNISMQSNGDSNFHINHTGDNGVVNLVSEYGPHDNDNFDNIVIDGSESMDFTGFNGSNDTLDVGQNSSDYTAFHWDSATTYGGYSSDLDTYSINDSTDLISAFSSNNGSGDLVIFADSGDDFTAISNAIGSVDIESEFDDIYLVIADATDGSGESADIGVWTWNGTSFTQNALLEDAYNEFFDGSGNVFDSNLTAGAYDHVFNYYFDYNFTNYSPV